ncbi:unnamed protein product [Paramecium octaurelia]|uniref:Protein kinase domain-containing protein n=1 Tax=Paramecium octaurelia TaxID=43137 RepID=A0A8S1UDM1_PAROT|nr:unnamed protein product [Paramecium octaurelia]
MPPKRQHHKTQSSEIPPQALMSYLSNREQIQARFSNSPTLQIDYKANKQLIHQQSPLLRSNGSQNNLRVTQQQQTQRKVQQSDLLKSKGFMSPKFVSQEKKQLQSKTVMRQGGNHIKTQPHSHQNSQSSLNKIDKTQDDYKQLSLISSAMPKSSEIMLTQPQSAMNKTELTLKQKADLAIQEMKQRQQEELFQRINFQKSLGVSSAKHQSQLFMQSNSYKSSSTKQLDGQKTQVHSASQPIIEINPNRPITNRKQFQDTINVILLCKTHKEKITVDVQQNSIQYLVDLVKQIIMKNFGTTLPTVIGIKTCNISIPVDYILSKVERPLSLLNSIQLQPLIIEPVFALENEIKTPRVSLKDFEFIRCIGMGGFSKVYMVRERRSGQYYAMKLIEKSPIIQQNKQSIIQNERDIMSILNHPFIVKMQYAFESRKYLVFVLEYCSGGELFYLLRKVKRMKEEEAFFYFSEICLGMKHLHENNIIYRDIKPENILIDFDGHVRIADFGLSKPNMTEQDIGYSFCGSPEYMAPEMLLKSGHTFQLDLYCLGALLYELVTGLPPYYSRNTEEIYTRILNQKLNFPPQLQLSPQIKDLLNNLLAKNPKNRIDNIETLLRHPWMVQWGDKNLYKDILQKRIESPFKTDHYSFNFDEEEFGQGEAEFLAFIKPLQQNISENFPKEIILKQFYYNSNEANFQESTGGTRNNQMEQQCTQRQKSKRQNTFESENQMNHQDQKLYLLSQLKLQTDHDQKRKSA